MDLEKVHLQKDSGDWAAPLLQPWARGLAELWPGLLGANLQAGACRRLLRAGHRGKDSTFIILLITPVPGT